MDLIDLRAQIDEIDAALVPLFLKRMELSAKVADYKKSNGLPIYVPEREQEILKQVELSVDSEYAESMGALYSAIFEISRAFQMKRNSQSIED